MLSKDAVVGRTNVLLPVRRESLLIALQIAKSKVIYISFQCLKKPKFADVFIRAHGKSLAVLKQEISTHLPPPPAAAAPVAIISKSYPLQHCEIILNTSQRPSSSSTLSTLLPLRLLLTSRPFYPPFSSQVSRWSRHIISTSPFHPSKRQIHMLQIL